MWCCLSLLAACVGDRVWIEKFRGKKLMPNLYVVLLGPSGLGKGEAIDGATKFVRNLPRVNMYRGKSSAAYIMKFLASTKRTPEGKVILQNSKAFLVTPELSLSIGSGSYADDLIKLLTDIYGGSLDPLRHGTVTRGEFVLEAPCINWLAGSTKEWLIQSVSRDAVSGGFFARIVSVEADYDYGKRIVEPEYPSDYDEVLAHLHARVAVLARTEGQFRKTDEAATIERQWYEGRPAPDDDTLAPAWKREHDLILKLAMLLALAEGTQELLIERDHIVQAQRLAQKVQRALPKLVTLAHTTQETEPARLVTEVLQRVKRIPHSVLLRVLSSRGMTAESLRHAMDTLMQSRRVTRLAGPRGGAVYVWTEGRRMPQGEEN